MSAPTRYYAVPDPADMRRMTFWRETSQGRSSWPKSGSAFGTMFRERLHAATSGADKERLFVDWLGAVDDEIEARPEVALARFAAIQSRCCICGRQLTDPASKVYGVGPECRSTVPAPILERLAEHMRLVVGGGQ